MPRYRMRCVKCGLIQYVLGSMNDPPKIGICNSCGEETQRWYHKARLQIQVFKPYVEDMAFAEPIEITSREQRDQVYASQGVTLDRVSRPRRKASSPLLTEKDLDTIVEEASKLSQEEVKASFKKGLPIVPEGTVQSVDYEEHD